MLRRLGQRLTGLFGGGKGGSGSKGGGSPWLAPVLIGVVVIGLWALVGSIHIIQEAERGVVLRFGQYQRTLSQGLQFAFPPPIETVERIDISRVREASDQGPMLTSDENIVEVAFSVQYRILDPVKFLYQVRDPEETLRQVVESAMRQVVGNNTLDFVLLEGRTQIAADARSVAQDVMDSYGTGVSVLTINLRDVRPPAQVKEAFDDAIKAREDSERFENEAEAYARAQIPSAGGRAARIRQDAEGYREAVVARATGEAERFSLLLAEYRKAPQVTRERLYLETMQQVFGSSRKIMVDADGANPLISVPPELLQPAAGSAPIFDLPGTGAGASSSQSSTPGREFSRTPNREPRR